MIGAREAGIDADAVLAWLHEAFGEEETMRFFPLFSLLAPETFAERGLDWTVTDLVSQVGGQLMRGAVAFSAAVAATAGGGDAHIGFASSTPLRHEYTRGVGAPREGGGGLPLAPEPST